MAIILGNKQVIDTDETKKIGIGIALPIQNGNTGFFKQTYNTSDAIKANITNLLSTRQGERLMQPNFGTKLWNILFENDSDNQPISEKIEQTIENAIRIWLPFISIQQIDVNKDDPSNRDKNIYNVSISFKQTGLQNLETVTFRISN